VKKIPLHPLLMAVFPVLFAYSRNMSLIPVSEVLRPLCVIVGVAFLGWVVGAWLLRSWARSALLVSVLLIGLFSFGPLMTGLKGEEWLEVHRQVAGRGWLVGLLLVTGVLAFFPRDISRIGTFLNICGVALVLSSGGAIFWHWVAPRGEVGILGNNLAGMPSSPGARPPDIFYVVLDGYGGRSGLEKAFGFSNEAFLKELERLGFYVAERSYSNYGQTDQSLASTLNMRYLDQLVPESASGMEARSLLHRMIGRNDVANYLKRWGYQFVVVTSGYLQLEGSSADVILGGKRFVPLMESVLWKMVPMEPPRHRTNYFFEEHRNNILSAFQYLDGLSRPTTSPRFIFAHLIVPHPPFVFDRDGHVVPPKRFFGIYDGSHYLSAGGTAEEYARGYVEQTLFVNKKVLEWLKTLMAHNPHAPPIVILQGDHGAKLRYDYEHLERTDFLEAYSILNAYYVPESIKRKLYDSITPVNSFRLLLSTLFDVPLPLLPEEHYYSTWKDPFIYVRITQEIRRGNMIAKRGVDESGGHKL
jgi:hypothetical protein